MNERCVLGLIMTGAFVVLMLALAITSSWLGVWQLQRLGQKEALVAVVDQRLNAAPIPVPAVGQWSSLDLTELNFRLVSLTGAFRYNQTVTVFTSLSSARGAASDPGYWVVTPFVLVDGGTVFVNRGFVPEALHEAVITNAESDTVQIIITGLLRPGERAGFMTPAPDISNRVEWVRDPVRLADIVDPGLAPFAPFYVDLRAGAPGELLQDGETVIEFPNNHLGYAYTWFGLAIVDVVMLGFWLVRQRMGARG
ncbi:MAG: SURF1 family protein [Candidatus Devosia symbiotica]|nr:SURF1 family protein [Candidatus Devosia symbiotica]